MFHLYFGESIPNLTDWIQAICAIGILTLTFFAFIKWRDQKKYDLNLVALTSIPLIKSIVWYHIFSLQHVLEELRVIGNTGVIKASDLYRTAREISELSTKFERDLLESNFNSNLAFIRSQKSVEREFKSTYGFYRELNRILDDQLFEPSSKLIIDYVDKRKYIDYENIHQCVDDFKDFSVKILPNVIDELSDVFEQYNYNPKQS